jgi:hypothetical protein
MDLQYTVLVSVAAGVLVLLLQWTWNNFLSTIILHLQKNEPRIAGLWKTSFNEEGKEYTETVTLKQHGRKTTGTIVLKDDDDEITYHFRGTFQNLILSGSYASVDEANFERGTILLQYKKKGQFVGQTSYFSKTSDKLVSSDYEWRYVKQ